LFKPTEEVFVATMSLNPEDYEEFLRIQQEKLEKISKEQDEIVNEV